MIVGITGGIATGKSQVSDYIKSLGYTVIDTDIISRSLTTENEEVLFLIRTTFGNEYFDNGVLNRRKMGELVFNNKEANKLLTNIVHPFVKKEVLKQVYNNTDKIVFIDVPLLYESGFDELCHQVICVYTSLDENIKRLIAGNENKVR